VLCSVRDLTYLVEVDGAAHRISRDISGVVRATAPSVVVSVDVAPGDQVTAGARIALLEAMKMELPVLAPVDGVVREVMVLNNAQVGTGAPLVLIEPAGTQAPASAGDRVLFRNAEPAQAASRRELCCQDFTT
jgi:pyruvate carboxylase